MKNKAGATRRNRGTVVIGAPVQAEAPSRAIAGSFAGPGLLAHVLVSKYCDHSPLYRQEEMYARKGVEPDRSTLAGWVGATSQLIEHLVEAIRRHVMSAEKLHADDTPIPVLAPENGKTSIGRLWTYVRDDQPAADLSLLRQRGLLTCRTARENIRKDTWATFRGTLPAMVWWSHHDGKDPNHA